MGHEPDSHKFSTLGRWVAMRASGMKTNVYPCSVQIKKVIRDRASNKVRWKLEILLFKPRFHMTTQEFGIHHHQLKKVYVSRFEKTNEIPSNNN